MSAAAPFACTSMSDPPLKSMPRFMLTVAKSTMDRMTIAAEPVKVMRLSHMKPILVPSGTKVIGPRGSSFGLDGVPRRRSASAVSTKAVKTVVMMPMASVTAETANRTGAQIKQDHGCDQRRQVGVDDRRQGFLEAGIDRLYDGASGCPFLAYSLEDQHVRIDRHADCEHDARNAWQCQRRTKSGQRRR